MSVPTVTCMLIALAITPAWAEDEAAAPTDHVMDHASHGDAPAMDHGEEAMARPPI